MPEPLDAALSVKPGENGAEQHSNKEDVDKAPQGPKAPTMKILEAGMGEIAEDRTHAYEGFGRVTEHGPIVPEFPPEEEHLRDEILAVRVHQSAFRKARVVLTKDILGFSAVGDPTLKHMSDHINLEEIQAAYEVEGDRDMVEIVTLEDGKNSGRIYQIHTSYDHSAENWTRDLISLAVKARSIKSSKYAVFKKTLREVYTANPTQIYITSVIICNFCLVAAESQIQPAKGTLTARNFATMDYFFSFLFLMDLEVNILAHWFWPFVRNPWNVFDFTVVSLGILNSFEIKGLEFLACARAFRIFMVAGKIRHLRRIVKALSYSVFPVLASFVIGIMFLLILAILGTFFFRNQDMDNFGTMFRTSYTLFLALAFGEWDVLSVIEDGYINWGRLIYLMLVVFFLVWITTNVIITILLDKFVQATVDDDNIDHKTELIECQEQNFETGGLDPLIHEILRVFDSSNQLQKGLHKIFNYLDYNHEGKITFQKAREGLKKINTDREIAITEEDWNVLTDKGNMCNSDGSVTIVHWERIMLRQIKHYIQRDITDIAAMNYDDPHLYHFLIVLRLLLEYDPGSKVFRMGNQIEEATKEMRNLRQGGLAHAVNRIEAASIAILRAKNTAIPTAMKQPMSVPGVPPPRPHYQTFSIPNGTAPRSGSFHDTGNRRLA